MVIWHDILFTINMVSKKLQSEFMYIDVTLKQIEGAISFFKKYINDGFTSRVNIAKFIASDMDIDPVFPVKRHVIRKKHFDETNGSK